RGPLAARREAGAVQVPPEERKTVCVLGERGGFRRERRLPGRRRPGVYGIHRYRGHRCRCGLEGTEGALMNLKRWGIRYAACFLWALGAAPAPAAEKHESFDRDPGWEGHQNRLAGTRTEEIRQDFGFSPDTRHAGGQAGEVGGLIQ